MTDQNNQQVDWDTYDLGAASKPQKAFPPKGNYQLRVPALKTSTVVDAPDSIFKRGADGQLKAEIGPLFIVGGPYDGFEIRFATISNKKYSNRNASQMGDFLLAAKSPFRPQTEDQWKQAVLATSNSVLEAHCDWEAYDKIPKKSLAEGMDKFPKNADGTYQRWINVPDKDAKDKNGNPAADGMRRVWANLRIDYFKVPRPGDAPTGAPLSGAGQTSGGTADLL